VTRLVPTLAALNGALAVTFGTAGAHLIQDPVAKGWLTTASTFQIAHAAAALGVLALVPDRLGRWLALGLSIGAFIFATTLGLMAFGYPRWLGAVTPVGGTLMLLSWVILGARFVAAPGVRWTEGQDGGADPR
jgi:uncharacterized membrane protein YgdD (TMEM256/DUF423 family)